MIQSINLTFSYRWKIFAYIISPELDSKILQNLPDPSFIYPVCQLYIMQHEWKAPVLFKWEVDLFLLEHLRFKKLTDSEFQEISQQEIIPDPRGVQLAAVYTRGLVDLASKLAGKIVPASLLMPLYCSFDGIHFQTQYNHSKSIQAVQASSEEMEIIHFYFDLVTEQGKVIKTHSSVQSDVTEPVIDQ